MNKLTKDVATLAVLSTGLAFLGNVIVPVYGVGAVIGAATGTMFALGINLSRDEPRRLLMDAKILESLRLNGESPLRELFYKYFDEDEDIWLFHCRIDSLMDYRLVQSRPNPSDSASSPLHLYSITDLGLKAIELPGKKEGDRNE
jgi:hypothetical protein